MRAGVLLAIAAGLALVACAGRDPHPVAVVQPQEANNAQVEKLATENNVKIAQNVAAGVVGVVVWPVFFAMDAKGAAGTEMDALKARQQYLASLAGQRCVQPAAPPAPPSPPPPRHAAAKPTPPAQQPPIISRHIAELSVLVLPQSPEGRPS
jgi:hypothetical protein